MTKKTNPAALEGILEQVNGMTFRARWCSDRIKSCYCQRALKKVQEQQSINFTSPCADLSALCASLARGQGLDSCFVLSFIERPLQHVKFQCNLEIQVEGLNYVLGFSETALHIFQGEIVEAPHRHVILRQKFDPENPSKTSFLHHFHEDGLSGLPKLFAKYKPDVDIRWHQQRNSRWRFLWTRLRARYKKGSTVYSGIRCWNSKEVKRDDSNSN
jgi:hypothetical protein